MAAISSMPGNWPGNETDDLFIPPLRLRRMESPLTRISTPYPTREDEMVTQGYLRDSHQSRTAILYPSHEVEILESRSRLQQQLQISSDHDEPPPYPTSPTLFIPGLGLPVEDRQGGPSRSPASPSPVGTDERSIPRMNLRVDTLTMQTATLDISSPRELGELYFNSPTSLTETTQPSQNLSQNFTSPSIRDELFFDLPLPLSNSPTNTNGGGPSTDHAFGPLFSEEHNLEETEWQLYEPPEELRRPRDGTSIIIESILVPSIDRIRARHEEEERQITAARAERDAPEQRNRNIVCYRDPTRRDGRQPDYLLTTEQPLESSRPPNIPGVLAPTISFATLHSPSAGDSGYSSTSPGTENASSAPARSRRSFERLSALFRRGKRSSRDQTYFDGLPSALNDPVWNPISSIPRATTSSSVTISSGSVSGVQL
jgi:hypothetical protein